MIRHVGIVESCSGEGWDLTLGRVVKGWNRLPWEVVNAPNPSVLRKHLKNALNGILWLLVSPEMVRKLDYMFISLPAEISYPVLSLNWITVGLWHVLCPLDAAMLRRAGREEERTPGVGHQGWHSSAPVSFCSLHEHSVSGFRHQLRLCLEVLQPWFVKCLCQMCKLGFFKDVFYGFLCQRSCLMVQVDAPWHLTSVAIFHLSEGREKLDKNWFSQALC